MKRCLLLLLLGLASCTVSVQRDGEDHFLNGKQLRMEAGSTTSIDVVKALGVPDRMSREENELRFFYRFQDLRTQTFILSAYGAKFINFSNADQLDTMLMVAFDEDDKLLYHGTSEGPLDRRVLFVDY